MFQDNDGKGMQANAYFLFHALVKCSYEKATNQPSSGRVRTVVEQDNDKPTLERTKMKIKTANGCHLGAKKTQPEVPNSEFE